MYEWSKQRFTIRYFQKKVVESRTLYFFDWICAMGSEISTNTLHILWGARIDILFQLAARGVVCVLKDYNVCTSKLSVPEPGPRIKYKFKFLETNSHREVKNCVPTHTYSREPT